MKLGALVARLCIKACPTDAILGSNKVMHTVIESACTGCDLCLPVCPVDCIEMVPISGAKTGWAAWSAELATQARVRYEARQIRLVKEEQEHAARQEAKAAMKLADLETHTHADRRSRQRNGSQASHHRSSDGQSQSATSQVKSWLY
jgi:Na+-translocating ferredoxin:NAD+ oxidoreductase subunit B